jgi:hypothetical protein
MQSGISLYGFALNHENKCNFGCRHCGYDSGPETYGQISLHKGERYIDQLPGLKTERLVFSGGGNPLGNDSILNEKTKRLVEYAHDVQRKTGHRFKVKIITNGSFATSEAEALHIIKEYGALGAMIIVSDDEFHEEFNQLYMENLRKVTRHNRYIRNLRFGHLKDKPLPFRRARRLLSKDELRWDYLMPCAFQELVADILQNEKIRLYGFPEGIHICVNKLGYHQDVDRITDVINGAFKDPLTKLFLFGLKSSLRKIEDELPKKMRDDIFNMPECVLCEELYEEYPRVLDILKDRSSEVFETVKQEDPERGHIVESTLQQVMEKNSS